MIQVPIIISREAPSQKNVIWATPSGDGYLLYVNTEGMWKPAGNIVDKEALRRDFFGNLTPELLELIKGDKGDPFTYADFTPEQLNALKGDSISSITQTRSLVDEGVNTITVTTERGTTYQFLILNGSKGDKGNPGDCAVYDPNSPDVPDFVMAQVLGNSTTKSMTQKAITESVTGKAKEMTLPNAVQYFYNGGTSWANNASRNSYVIEAESMRGQLLKIEPNESWSFGMKVCFVSVMPTNTPSNPGLTFCNGESGEIQQTTTLLKRIPDDCAAIIIRATDNVNSAKTDVTPEEVSLVSDYTALAKDMKQAKEDIEYLMSKPANLYDGIGGNTDGAMTQKATTDLVSLKESVMPFVFKGYYVVNGVWTATVNGRHSTYMMPAENLRGKMIVISPNETWADGMRVCFVKAEPEASQSLVFCDGEDGEIQSNEVLSKVVPNDCVYILIRKGDYVSSQKVDVSPSEISVASAVIEDLEKVKEGSYVILKDVVIPNVSSLYWIRNENGNWANDALSRCVLIDIEDHRGRTLKMSPSLTWAGGMRFAFLASINSLSSPSGAPDYCDEQPSVIQTLDEVHKVIPQDCKYLYIQVSNREGSEGVDCAPSACTILDTVGEAVGNMRATSPSNIGDDINIQKAYTISPFGKTSSLYAKDAAKRMMADNVLPFILIVGQSNADGRCKTTDAPEWLSSNDYAIDDYMMWNNSNKAFATFSVTSNNGAGTTNGSTATSNQTYSFDAYFAHLYIEHFGTPLYALKHTIGATPIHKMPTSGMVTASWNPDIDDFPSGCRPLLAELITKLKSMREWATNNGKVLFPVAILWHQGETDADNNDYQYYHDDLANVLGFIRGCFGAQSIPILSGYINEQYKSAYSQINDALDTIASEDEYYKVVDMSNHFTGITGDLVHYNAEAIEYMGEQMFADYLTLNKGI